MEEALLGASGEGLFFLYLKGEIPLELLLREVPADRLVVAIDPELYPNVVDGPEKEGGVPSRLLKTDRRKAEKEGTPWWMFAGERGLADPRVPVSSTLAARAPVAAVASVIGT